MITADLGKSMASACVESMIALWNGVPGSGRGREPVASTTCRASMVSSGPCGVLFFASRRSTPAVLGEAASRTVCHCGSTEASRSRLASAWKTVTPRWASSADSPWTMVETTCVRRSCTALKSMESMRALMPASAVWRTASKVAVMSSSVLVGMQPRLRQVPPGVASRSMSATFRPSWEARRAVE